MRDTGALCVKELITYTCLRLNHTRSKDLLTALDEKWRDAVREARGEKTNGSFQAGVLTLLFVFVERK